MLTAMQRLYQRDGMRVLFLPELPQQNTGWLTKKNISFSPSSGDWGSKSKDSETPDAGLFSFEASLLGLQTETFSLCPIMPSLSVHVHSCCPSVSYKNTSSTGLRLCPYDLA